MARALFSTRRKMQKEQKNQSSKPLDTQFAIEIGKDINENMQSIKKMLGEPEDLVIREVTIGATDGKCAILYISGLIDTDLVNNNIIKSLQLKAKQFEIDTVDEIYQEVITIVDSRKVNTLDEVSLAILSGSTALYLDGMDTVLLMDTSGGERRSIEEPQSESLIRGPRTGFVENIQTNISLLRRDIRDPNLRMESHELGRRSKQKIVVCYVEGIVNPDLVTELNNRLASIDIDFAQDSGFVEQWIEDSFLSPFPQLINTERPDTVSLAMLQGKVGVLVDGTPFALVAPLTIGNYLQSIEDYNERWSVSTVIRILRYLAAFIALFLPALFIALVSFHPGMLPTKLVYSIAASRQGVPFPAVIEALLMGITMEILHEAGIRLPKLIGQTIGIVGGLVIGEAAVTAGIVSPIMVIITALTAIASFTIPSYSGALSLRLLRFGLMLAAATLGLYGIILFYIMLNIHIVNLKSLGVPFSAPFAPSFTKDWKDLVIRAPMTMLTQRPEYLKPMDKQSKNLGGE